MAVGRVVAEVEGKREREGSEEGLLARVAAEEAEAVGCREAEGKAEGELVPRRCTAPAFGPDTLVQSAPLWHGPEQSMLVSPVVSP